jgi:hypothetical protein
MKRILQFFSLTGILLTILPPVLFFLGKLSYSAQNLWMLAGAIIWFLSASFWLGSSRERKQQNKYTNDVKFEQ